MKHRISTKEEVKIITDYLVEDLVSADLRFFDKKTPEDEITNHRIDIVTTGAFMTIETDEDYKIIIHQSYAMGADNYYDIYTSKYVLFSSGELLGIDEWEILKKGVTPEYINELNEVERQETLKKFNIKP